ncbi:unnamed protein product [Allacma fusca]|uniref:Uncharacterized protein n=1 Tax=Allacma fusca TaxID=39272 RepID=A0A8J2NRC8_9HEXA|nr:unnamed protein product [Allacma fusca]
MNKFLFSMLDNLFARFVYMIFSSQDNLKPVLKVTFDEPIEQTYKSFELSGCKSSFARHKILFFITTGTTGIKRNCLYNNDLSLHHYPLLIVIKIRSESQKINSKWLVAVTNVVTHAILMAAIAASWSNHVQKERQSPEKQYWHPPAFFRPPIPVINISEDTCPFLGPRTLKRCEKTVRNSLKMIDTNCYDANRGPILRIRGRTKDAVLTFKEFMKLDKNGIPIKPKLDDCSDLYPPVEDLFLSDELESFATTRMCKQTQCVALENEGTTAIRYLWLRSPPTRAMRRILGRPGNVLNVKKLHPPSDEPFFWKDDNFEFHFRELPGVILPGQYIKFPIIFRSHRNGYFYEDLYLLTHPRLSDDNDCVYKLRLTGFCMDPDCPLPPSNAPQLGKNACRAAEISRKIKSKLLYSEADDCLDSMLDTILYSTTLKKSTLPNGKITVEQIFYTHNRDMHYSYDVAEKALKNVRELVKDLVSRDRIIDNDSICPLSIQSLYNEIARVPTPTDYFWNKFKSPKTEETLTELAQQAKRLFKPRVFSWPSIKSRLYSSCYTTMVSTVDEVVAKITNIDFDSDNQNLDKVLRKEIRNILIRRKQKELRRQKRRAERQRRKQNRESQRADGVDERFDDRGDTFETPGEVFDTEENGEGYDLPPPIFIPEEEIEAELQELRKKKEKRSKQILFETLFGCGVERMMSVVDSYRAMCDYRESPALQKCEQSTCSKQ